MPWYVRYAHRRRNCPRTVCASARVLQLHCHVGSQALRCMHDLKVTLCSPGQGTGSLGTLIADEPCAFHTLRHQSNFRSAPESSARIFLALATVDSAAIPSGNPGPETCAKCAWFVARHAIITNARAAARTDGCEGCCVWRCSRRLMRARE